jgi:hypothetical protein
MISKRKLQSISFTPFATFFSDDSKSKTPKNENIFTAQTTPKLPYER